MTEKVKVEQKDAISEITPAQIWFKKFEYENGRKPTSDEFLQAKNRNFSEPINWKKILLIASLSVVVVVVIGVVAFQINHHDKVKEAKITLNTKIKGAESLNKEIEAAYMDNKTGFLKKTVTAETLEKFDSKLKKLFINKIIEDQTLKTLKQDYRDNYHDTERALTSLKSGFDAQTG